MIILKIISIILLGILLIAIGFVIGVVYAVVRLDDYIGPEDIKEDSPDA